MTLGMVECGTMWTPARIFLVLMLMTSLGGCVALGPPRISIDSIEINAASEDGLAVTLHGTIENPHNETIRLLEFDYSLAVSGRSVYSGRHAAEMTLIGGATRPIALPAAFTLASVGWSSSALPEQSRWSMSGSLLYLSEGVLAETLLDMGFRPTATYSASGVLAMQASP